MTQPLLYSFRRCPYAIRARLAIASAGIPVELREVVLRNKPEAFLATSPSGTVPCLAVDATAIDESLDIMLWALRQHDPEGWLAMPGEGFDWIARNDGPFKAALDRTKYADRYPGCDPDEERRRAGEFLTALDGQIEDWIFGRPTLADYAILPFVRQFALIDKAWFDAQDWPDLQAWLARFLASDRFERVMEKYAPWQPGARPVHFPGAAPA
ncbi:glutathione S-transferase [Hoeflea olei]|uniref:Glutathione S-transferase n=1 Tax=Hoeflea olei TaxID=1480615 RepID=A0A1C1YRV6_9HYPH|nr:glutathione S-transferase [Hoeflea olei]OCW56233.1 glutathione S-transferase [Hoeflea olei]